MFIEFFFFFQSEDGILVLTVTGVQTCALPICRNVRDLGGYRTPAGRTRWGALVRADSLGQLTPAGQSSLIAYGIRTVIDIRFPEEAPRDPNPFADQSGGADAPAYLNIPVNSGRDPAMDAALMAARGGCQCEP